MSKSVEWQKQQQMSSELKKFQQMIGLSAMNMSKSPDLLEPHQKGKNALLSTRSNIDPMEKCHQWRIFIA